MITAGEAVRKAQGFFDGINQRDMDLTMAGFTDDAVFEFVVGGPDDRFLRGKENIVENLTGWWKAEPEIVMETTGVLVDRPWPGAKREVALEWNQSVRDREGTKRRRRGVTILVVTGKGIVECRDYFSDPIEVDADR